MNLKDWLNKGWVVSHKTSPEEIAELFGVADRDLDDCKAEGLSPHWKLAIAYNAALQMATAALAACGYRSSREAHHLRVIQSLRYTTNAEPSLVVEFDAFRKSGISEDTRGLGPSQIRKRMKWSSLPRNSAPILKSGLRKIIPNFLRTNVCPPMT